MGGYGVWRWNARHAQRTRLYVIELLIGMYDLDINFKTVKYDFEFLFLDVEYEK